MSLEDLAALGIEAPKAVDQYLADNLPECQFPKLKDEPITVIDDVVKNCQTKEKKGQIPDGL